MPRPRRDSKTLLTDLREASFTPAVRDVAGLLDLLQDADDSLQKSIERSIARVGRPAAAAILERLPASRRPVRGHLIKILGRIAQALQDKSLADVLLSHLADEDLKARRNAIIALGHLPLAGVEDALLDKWTREDRIDHRRSLAASLGKIGGPASLAALGSYSTDDPELKKIISQAMLILERQSSRQKESAIAGMVPAAFSVPIIAECRQGLEKILLSEFDPSWKPKVLGKGKVGAILRGPLESVFQARTFMRFGVPLPPLQGDVAETVVRALTGDLALRIFKTWTRGQIRYRLDWGTGHRRSAVWQCAKQISEKCSDLINDPSDSTWEAVVHEIPGGTQIVLHPKKLADPRFQYRIQDVYAASHPTLAAALVRIAGVEKNDVVWDPFAGSGTELIERALAGPYKELHGTDIESRAIEAARKNFKAAGVDGARLFVADGLVHQVPNATLVITNPPMGRRSRRGDVGPLLKRFLEHAASVLVPHGRLVWISPMPERHAGEAGAAGLKLTFQQHVDMGGFQGQIQRYEKI